MKTEKLAFGPVGQARLGEAEAVVLRQIAAEEHLNVSETIRFLIREAARERSLWPPKQPTELERRQ